MPIIKVSKLKKNKKKILVIKQIKSNFKKNF